MIELITKSVGSIVNAIQQSAVLSVRSIKAHVFTTKVSNLPEVQKITGEVKVNQTGTEKALFGVKISVGRVENAVKAIKIPSKIEVTNFPKPAQFPNFPKEIAVSNLPKQKEFPKEFTVTNQPTKELSDINDSVGKLSGEIKKLKLDPTINVSTPAPVVVPAPNVTVTQQEIDYDKLAKSVLAGQTKIDYDKLAEAIGKEVAGMMVTTGGGNTSANAFADGHPGKALLDEQRHMQVDVLTMPEITIDQPTNYPLPASQVATLTPPAAITGFSTEAKQNSQITLETNLNSLVETLQELIQRLAPLAGAMGNTAQLRVVQTSVPSTAVTGPITSAQSIAEKAAGGISYPEKMAITNLTAISSNINNVVVT